MVWPAGWRRDTMCLSGCALNLSWSLQGEYPAIRVDPGSQQQAVANPVAEAPNPG